MDMIKAYFSVTIVTLLLVGCHSKPSKESENIESVEASGSVNKSLPPITGQGVGELKIGIPLAECLIEGQSDWVPTKEDIMNSNEMKFGFYNKVGLKLMNFTDTDPYVLLFDNDELMAALGCYSLMYDGISSINVREIIVYSPKLKMANGIHVGMTAKDLVDNFGADIKLEQGVETDVLEFEVADIPSNIVLLASARKINREKTDSEYGEENSTLYLTLNDVEDCVLSAIVIE